MTKPHQQHHTIDEAIAPPATRRRRASLFHVYLVLASVVFVVLAVLARASPYFPIDLTITRAFQSQENGALAWLMYALSWIGFIPQVFLLGGAVVVGMFAMGLRWEAVVLLVAALGPGVGSIVKQIVYRPRPSPDLVDVLSPLASPSFPSGHVMTFATVAGFLLFLVYTLLRPSWTRRALIVVLGVIIAGMGPSRIYLGQHWFSDVMGAYVLGSLWLTLTVAIYRWGKPRFFVRQPVAPPPKS